MLQIETVEVSDLISDPANVRKHDDRNLESIKGSLTRFGQQKPIVVDSKGVVIAGNGTLSAARSLGWSQIDIVRTDLDGPESTAFAIADNRTAELAEWDNEALIDTLSALANVDEELVDAAGFNHEDLEAMLDDLSQSENSGLNADHIPAEPVDPKTKLGDVYELGKHRLICGDATDPEAMQKLMTQNYDSKAKKRAAICFTSPPYNVSGNAALDGNTNLASSKYGTSSDDLDDSGFLNLLCGFTNLVLEHSDFAFVNIQSLAPNKTVLIDYLHAFRNRYADTAIWAKTHTAPAMAEKVMNSQFEYIHIFSNKENPSRAIGTRKFRGTVSNIYNGSPQMKNEFSKVHGATFPLEFARWGIENFTNPGDVVLDPFCGTGTSMIVAEQTNRICYGVELSPIYCDVIVERWEKFTQKKAELVDYAMSE